MLLRQASYGLLVTERGEPRPIHSHLVLPFGSLRASIWNRLLFTSPFTENISVGEHLVQLYNGSLFGAGLAVMT